VKEIEVTVPGLSSFDDIFHVETLERRRSASVLVAWLNRKEQGPGVSFSNERSVPIVV